MKFDDTFFTFLWVITHMGFSGLKPGEKFSILISSEQIYRKKVEIFPCKYPIEAT